MTVSPQQCSNAIRVLAIDAVEKARSGHPGMPLGMADCAEALWRHCLKHNPSNPMWWNRDRFVLSNGHGSMLLYACLYLSGYDVSIDDLKAFRQLHSKTPGHPEVLDTPGVETTTGPLGQGLANAVGMAIAQSRLAAEFNRPGFDIIDNFTYAFVGDGCLMEGISHEVASLAGTLKLGKLIVLWDDNGISIDGDVRAWFSDDTLKRFESYQWQVIGPIDGHDGEAVLSALAQAKAETSRPTIIDCRTTIGFGAPTLAGSEKSHGAPLGEEEISGVRKALGWAYPPFEIPEDITSAWDMKAKGAAAETEWNDVFDRYSQAHADLAAELKRRLEGRLPSNWQDESFGFIQAQQEKQEKVASRKASLQTLNAWYAGLPELFGGSADLTGSNLTKTSEAAPYSPASPSGDYLYYGVREFGMSAIMNGMALYGGFIPFGGTFLVFSDYARNAIRMSALMKQRVIYVMTHDSIGLGEDGPTHQPVEHLASLRVIPNCFVWRPCDAVETAVAWKCAIEQMDAPSVLALSRQGLPACIRTSQQVQDIEKGAYAILECDTPDIVMVATGSELSLAVEAAALLHEKGHQVRVVSVPCVEKFLLQPQSYQDALMPKALPTLILEAGVPDTWYRFAGVCFDIMGIESFGVSAPGAICFETYGFTSVNVVKRAQKLLEKT